MSGVSYFSGPPHRPAMVGYMGALVGGIVIVALVVVGLWLTWISLRSEQHQPKALRQPEPDEAE